MTYVDDAFAKCKSTLEITTTERKVRVAKARRDPRACVSQAGSSRTTS